MWGNPKPQQIIEKMTIISQYYDKYYSNLTIAKSRHNQLDKRRLLC